MDTVVRMEKRGTRSRRDCPTCGMPVKYGQVMAVVVDDGYIRDYWHAACWQKDGEKS